MVVNSHCEHVCSGGWIENSLFVDSLYVHYHTRTMFICSAQRFVSKFQAINVVKLSQSKSNDKMKMA